MSDLPDAKEWVERASQNAQGAADLLQARNWPLGVCELAQQAIEMSIKAVLISHHVEYQFIHDLNQLRRDLPSEVGADIDVGEDELHVRLTYLSSLWTAKYPTANPPRAPTWEDAESAMALANQFIEWAEAECGVDPLPSPSPTATPKAP